MITTYGIPTLEFIRFALAEDSGDGDHTSLACINKDVAGEGIVRAKENGIVAGIVLADLIFIQVDSLLVVKTLVNEGEEVIAGQELIHVKGNLRSILKAERLALNCMQRMSGIATKTRSFVRLIEGTMAKILDTRKTTPNCRFYEKWAVQAGGGVNHRFGLYDMILVKDNHIDVCGGVTNALKKVSHYLSSQNLSLPVIIEARNFEEIKEVLNCQLSIVNCQLHRILLDNFNVDDLQKAIALIDGRIETEASGGINEQNVRQIAETGVDYISIGSLTHSFKSLDINLKLC